MYDKFRCNAKIRSTQDEQFSKKSMVLLKCDGALIEKQFSFSFINTSKAPINNRLKSKRNVRNNNLSTLLV